MKFYPNASSAFLPRILLAAAWLGLSAVSSEAREPVPQWGWLTEAGSTNYSGAGNHGAAVDCAGNLWLAGGFSGRLTLPGGGGVTAPTSPSSLILRVHYKTGQPAQAFAGYGDVANAIALDTQEQPVIGGYAGSSFFVASYDASGNLLWKQVSSGGSGNTAAVAVDGADDVFMAGGIGGGTVMFGTNQLVCNANKTVPFLAKLAGTNGTILWAKTIPFLSDNNATAAGVATDPAGNVYVAGQFTSKFSVFARSNQTSVILTNSSGSLQMFLAKYDPDGNLIQIVQSLTGDVNWSAEGEDVKVTAAGEVYVTGAFYGGTPFASEGRPLSSSSGGDVFLAAFTDQLQPFWACGGHVNDPSGLAESYSLALDAFGNVELIGTSSGAITFDFVPVGSVIVGPYVPPTNEVVAVTSGKLGFVAKYDVGGELEWVNGGGGQPGFSCVAGAVDPAGSTYIAGSDIGTNIFGSLQASGTNGLTLYTAKLPTAGPLLKATPLFGSEVFLGWSSLADGYHLESSDDLAHWVTVTNASTSDGCNTSVSVENPRLPGGRYYRLAQ